MIKAVYLLMDDGDQQFMAEYDLTSSQFFALKSLAKAPKSMSQLSSDMLCDPSNITRVAGILERKGLLSRIRDTVDRRVVKLELTPEGEQLCASVQQTHEAYVQQRMQTLSPDEQSRLISLLQKLDAGLRQQLHAQPASTAA